MILQANGTPYDEKPSSGLPIVRREPPSWAAGKFTTVDQCETAANLALWGQFQYPAWLVEQTMRSSRVRGPFQTRLNALIGTEIQWLPGRDNAKGRLAAKKIVEDWPLMVSGATRYQLSSWGLSLGVSFAQKHWYVSPSSNRKIPRLEVFHPQWGMWDWSLNDRRGAYRVWTLDGWEVVPSPALMVPGEVFDTRGGYTVADPQRWVVHEPFGTRSWREGLIHAIWASAIGWQFADSDMSALSEKQGVGGFKLKYPKTTEGKKDGKVDPASGLGLMMAALRKLGRNPVIPVEVYPANSQLASYDVETFEWSGVGFEIVQGTKDSKAQDIAVIILGHNTTVSSTTAGASAGANVGNDIRADYRVGDCWNECDTFTKQLLADWAAENFDDPGAAPIPIYVTKSPMSNVPAAQTLLNVAQAVQILNTQAPGVDATRLLELFQVPMGDGGAGKPLLLKQGNPTAPATKDGSEAP